MGNVNMEAYQIHTSDKDAPTVQKALDSLKTSESQTAEALAVKADRIDIAPIFSTETAYTAGDLVYHSNRLWKFTTDHAAGAWNAEEVEASNVDMAIKGAGGGTSLPDYSTSEQNTGIKWHNGSDIYFKTFTNVGVTPNASNWSDVVEIPGIASIVKAELLSDTGIYISGNGIELNINNSMLRAVYNQSLNMRTIGTMTIWYTKSTT